MQPMATIALRAAREASLKITRAFDRPDLVKIDEKGHNDYVTNVDREVERIIAEALHETYPDHAISGEEQISNVTPEDAEYEWIIDPIDGTMNFVRQIPHFCISIACLHKGKLEHGIEIEPHEPHLNASVLGDGDFALGRRVELPVGVSVNVPRQQFVVQPCQLDFEIGDPAPVSFLLTVKHRLPLRPARPIARNFAAGSAPAIAGCSARRYRSSRSLSIARSTSARSTLRVFNSISDSCTSR